MPSKLDLNTDKHAKLTFYTTSDTEDRFRDPLIYHTAEAALDAAEHYLNLAPPESLRPQNVSDMYWYFTQRSARPATCPIDWGQCEGSCMQTRLCGGPIIRRTTKSITVAMAWETRSIVQHIESKSILVDGVTYYASAEPVIEKATEWRPVLTDTGDPYIVDNVIVPHRREYTWGDDS